MGELEEILARLDDALSKGDMVRTKALRGILGALEDIVTRKGQPIIAFTGGNRSGKTTAAEITRGLVPDSVILPFAQPIYAALEAMIGRRLSDADKDGTLPELGISLREALITLGTDWGRLIVGTNVWVNLMEMKIWSYYPRPIIIPDVRFPNEAKWVKEKGGRIFLVRRWMGSEEGIPGHLLDGVIENNGTLEELTNSLKQKV